jgi:hypothetical protein
VELSPKAIRFIIEALDYRINAYRERLKLENLDEDEISDITNDFMFLEALREEMAKTLGQKNYRDRKINFPRQPEKSVVPLDLNLGK